MNVLDLFSGIGGFSLGLERAGMRTVAFCEIEPFCRAVLRKHWPGVPCFEDVRSLHASDIANPIDIICGGFPCQDISYAGKGAGLEGERSGLWWEYHRLIEEIKPRRVIIENVDALRTRGLEDVLRSLTEIGYDAEWHCVPAGAIGAPHLRKRIWIVAYPNSEGIQGSIASFDSGQVGSWGWRGKEDLQSVANSPFQPGGRWPTPLLRRMDDGIPNRSHRVKSMGNSIVPQIAEMIGKSIMKQYKGEQQ